MELYNTNLSVGATKKPLISFASDKFLAEEATESKLTNTGQHLPKRRYRLVTLFFSQDKGCWQGWFSVHWLNSLLQDVVFAHYLGNIAEFSSSSVSDLWKPSDPHRNGSSCLENRDKDCLMFGWFVLCIPSFLSFIKNNL